MPSCKVCGIDIPEPGLCAECRAEKAAAAKKVRTGGKTKSHLRPGIFIAGFGAVVLAVIIVFILVPGLTPGAQNLGATQSTAGAGTGNGKDADLSLPTVEKDTETLTAPADADGEKTQGKTQPVAYDIAKITDTPPIDNREEYIKWMRGHTTESEAALSMRWNRAQEIIESGQGEFSDKNALRAYLLTPREQFTRGQDLFVTYGDRPLQIGYGQTITAPNVMAMMTSSLKVGPQHKVLEIGMGSGFQAAVLSRMTNYVYTIEIIEGLYKETDKLFSSLEKQYPSFKNIKRKLADGYYGWEKFAPFDRIIITCSIDHLPAPLIKQLKVGGIIIVPLGPPYRQFLMSIEKVRDENGEIRLVQKDVYDGMGVIFVPFTNKEGQSYSE